MIIASLPHDPATIDDAVTMLRRVLTPEDEAAIKDKTSDPCEVHFMVGISLRNYWRLWDRSTPLVKWFWKTYKINHADDISGMILDALWRTVRGQDTQHKANADRYLAHWKNYKTTK